MLALDIAERETIIRRSRIRPPGSRSCAGCCCGRLNGGGAKGSEDSLENGARRIRGSVEVSALGDRGLSKAHLAVHRVTSGRVLGSVAGMPVLLLTTTGRRSGKARTTPLTFFRDGTAFVVIASNGGADRPPDWSLNLQDTPRAVVEIGTDKLVVTARPASEQQRERLWVVIIATYAGYARYQERTTRRIPVVLLTPESSQIARRP